MVTILSLAVPIILSAGVCKQSPWMKYVPQRFGGANMIGSIRAPTPNRGLCHACKRMYACSSPQRQHLRTHQMRDQPTYPAQGEGGGGKITETRTTSSEGRAPVPTFFAHSLPSCSLGMYTQKRPTVSVRGGKNSSDWKPAMPSVSASLALAWMRSMILASGSEVMVSVLIDRSQVNVRGTPLPACCPGPRVEGGWWFCVELQLPSPYPPSKYDMFGPPGSKIIPPHVPRRPACASHSEPFPTSAGTYTYGEEAE